LRRFLLHVLPHGFVRIRHYGLLANRHQAAILTVCFALLSTAPQPPSAPAHSLALLWSCPHCGNPMLVVERLTPVQIFLRSPPRKADTAPS
jgi:hypothetical protein